MSEEMQEFVAEIAEQNNNADDDQNDGVDDGEVNEGNEEEEEYEEIDVGGKKLSVPKSSAEILKEERMLKPDYTRKTQEAAEQRKENEAQKLQHQEQVKVHQANLREVAAIISLDDTIEQYKNVDWDALSDADPIESHKHFVKYQQLMQARTEAVQKLDSQQKQQALDAQQSRAKQLEQSFAVISRDVRGWNLDIANKVFSYGEVQGYSADELRQNAADPRFMKLLHGNYVAAELTKKATTRTENKPVVKPATVVSNKAPSVKKDPVNMPPNDFSAWMRSK